MPIHSSVAFIEHAAIRRLCSDHPRISSALWRATLVDAAIYREWVLNVGQRAASNRLAHLFCELITRMDAVGLAHGDSCRLKLTQHDLSEATGLSVVHVNRTLQDLRTRKLLAFDGERLTILNWKALSVLASFEPDYLHLPARHVSLEPDQVAVT